MNVTVQAVLTVGLGLLALGGAVAVVMTKDVMRLILGLGAVLLSVAGLFGIAGATFLAIAEVFVYVGGVLVLFLFAIMLVQRSEGAKPVLSSRHDMLSFVVAAGAFLMVVITLAEPAKKLSGAAMSAGVKALSEVLLHSMVAHFEAAGILLVAGLVAVVSILGGEDR
jgi:NADH-quinone oxidoreductase subunit J